MSFGIHRFWKNQFVKKIKIPEGDVLDVASGTADIAFRILEFNESKINLIFYGIF